MPQRGARASGPQGSGGAPPKRRVSLRLHSLTGERPMTSRRISLACVAVLFAASPSALAAQQTGTVSGTVLAAKDGAPLASVSVVIVGTARTALTNAQGQYHVAIPAGAVTVRARLIGYESAEQRVTVQAGQTATADFRLAATPLTLNEIVVVGARTSRTATETPVPVDVVSAQEMVETGQTEVNQMLAAVAPSFNASHQTIADGSDHVNPASLRGLGPDQVLVLVNGKRRYSSALVHVNGTFGRGTVGVDLNAIPAAAIERIEVLRDGASAQYGSDAIAGVINIVLKRQPEHARGLHDARRAERGHRGDGVLQCRRAAQRVRRVLQLRRRRPPGRPVGRLLPPAEPGGAGGAAALSLRVPPGDPHHHRRPLGDRRCPRRRRRLGRGLQPHHGRQRLPLLRRPLGQRLDGSREPHDLRRWPLVLRPDGRQPRRRAAARGLGGLKLPLLRRGPRIPP